MTLTIKLSDEDAILLQAKAAAEGLSVEEWIQKLVKPDLIRIGLQLPYDEARDQHRPRRYAVGDWPVALRNAEQNELVSQKPSSSPMSVTDSARLANKALARSIRRVA